MCKHAHHSDEAVLEQGTKSLLRTPYLGKVGKGNSHTRIKTGPHSFSIKVK